MQHHPPLPPKLPQQGAVRRELDDAAAAGDELAGGVLGEDVVQDGGFVGAEGGPPGVGYVGCDGGLVVGFEEGVEVYVFPAEGFGCDGSEGGLADCEALALESM